MTYEFPPTGGGGVQRVAKFCRYLPDSGWTPVVVSAEHVPGRPLDASLATETSTVEVVRTPARHVSTAISQLIKPAKDIVRSGPRATTPDTVDGDSGSARALHKPSLSRRLARWVTVPDDAVLWKGPAIEAAVRVGHASDVEAVIATGPPYSVVIAGAEVARRLGVPFLADMRDAWDRNPGAIFPTPLHRAISRSQERRSLSSAAAVTCTAPAIGDEALAFGATRVETIPNGFDPSDLPAPARDAAGPLKIAFMGRIYFPPSDPTPLLAAMARCANDDGPAAHAEFDIVGTWPESIVQVVAQLGLEHRVRFHAYRPHREALDIVAEADIGLALVGDLPGAETTAPAKLYEYLGMGMCALVLGPTDGFPARVIDDTGGGVVLSALDGPGLDATLRELAAAKASGTLPVPDPRSVSHYDRREQVRELARVLDSISATGR